MNTPDYLAFGLQTLTKTRSFILEKCRTGFHVATKEDDTLVTEVDRETEQLMRREIEQHFPQHGIIGEEFGSTNENAEFRWYLDPIDGTLSFSHGIPLYGTLLALYQGETPLVGIIDHPGLGLCYYASKGQGAFCNGEKITLTDTSNLDEEIIATGDRWQFAKTGTLEAYKALLEQHKLVRTVPDCFGHTLAAKGAVGAMLDFHINAWDIAATKILIEEAGGKFLPLKKTELPDGGVKHNIICGKPKVVEWLGELF